MNNEDSNLFLILKISFLCILIIIFGVLIFFFGTFLGKKYASYKRKNEKRADELEEEIITDNNIN